ncbi:hypothetical protein T492DRAFT_904736 [Pavlovales sp. CCMP2436]|nr:hypothetical protein T492DRAFT_904736 [Pavlovales sp. CCMP2436]
MSTHFALLVPCTSRKTPDVKANIARLLESVRVTTSSSSSLKLLILFGVDAGDLVCDPKMTRGVSELDELARRALPGADISTRDFELPPGHVCLIWADLARKAFDKGADFAVLLGDDVELLSHDWPATIRGKFEETARERGLPFGFACVAFADESFPSFPSFPVLHRSHAAWMPAVIPDVFTNQNADPFLFQVYSAFGAARIEPRARLANGIGGQGSARYEKTPIELLTLDIIVSTFRVPLKNLEKILELRAPPGTSVQFIIISDALAYSAKATVMCDLQDTYRDDPMLIFLDDDILPDAGLIAAYAAKICEHPRATGFVGLSKLPKPANARQVGIKVAGVSFFWTIARFMPARTDLPWGVTANICIRRPFPGPGAVRFSDAFPKTGGGEDIDFCLRLRAARRLLDPGSEGLVAAVDARILHPYWDDGWPRAWHFGGWALGDGYLTDLYPALSYYNLPNLVETVGALGVFGELLPCAAVFCGFTSSGGLFLARSTLVACNTAVARLVANLGRRFNWFGEMWPGAPAVERANACRSTLLRGVVAAAAKGTRLTYEARDCSQGLFLANEGATAAPARL